MDWLWKGAVFLLLLVIVTGLVILIVNPVQPTSIQIKNVREEANHQVGVYGAVKTPGVYNYKGRVRVSDAVGFAGGLSENADGQYADLARWVYDGETVIIPTFGVTQPTLTLSVQDDGKINLNTATRAELMTLPGIGEKRADDIIRLREEKGVFNRVEDIMEIPGIGEKLMESIYDRLIIE